MEGKKTKRGKGSSPGGHGRMTAKKKKQSEVMNDKERQDRFEAASVLSSLKFLPPIDPPELPIRHTRHTNKSPHKTSPTLTYISAAPATGIPIQAPSALKKTNVIKGTQSSLRGSGILNASVAAPVNSTNPSIILAHLQNNLQMAINQRIVAPQKSSRAGQSILPQQIELIRLQNIAQLSKPILVTPSPSLPSVVQTAEASRLPLTLNSTHTVNKTVANLLRHAVSVSTKSTELKHDLNACMNIVKKGSVPLAHTLPLTVKTDVSEKGDADSPSSAPERMNNNADNTLPLKKRRLVAQKESTNSEESSEMVTSAKPIPSQPLPSNRLSDLTSAAHIENILQMARDYPAPITENRPEAISLISSAVDTRLSPVVTGGGYRPGQFDPRTSLLVLSDFKVALTPDDDGDLPIHIAVVHENTELVVKFIDIMAMSGKSLDRYNKLQQTPLHLAVLVDKPDIVSALLLAGANPNLQDRNGRTAIHIAVEKIFHECLDTIWRDSKIRLELNSRNYEGYPPLHTCVEVNDFHCLLFLAKRGADTNITDGKAGRSVVFYATEYNRVDMVEYLITECDVNAELLNYASVSPYMTAVAAKYSEIMNILQKAIDISKVSYDDQMLRDRRQPKVAIPRVSSKSHLIPELIRSRSNSISQDTKQILSRRSSSNQSPIDLSFPRNTESPNDFADTTKDKVRSHIIQQANLKSKHTQIIAALEGRSMANYSSNRMRNQNFPVEQVCMNGFIKSEGKIEDMEVVVKKEVPDETEMIDSETDSNVSVTDVDPEKDCPRKHKDNRDNSPDNLTNNKTIDSINDVRKVVDTYTSSGDLPEDNSDSNEMEIDLEAGNEARTNVKNSSRSNSVVTDERVTFPEKELLHNVKKTSPIAEEVQPPNLSLKEDSGPDKDTNSIDENGDVEKDSIDSIDMPVLSRATSVNQDTISDSQDIGVVIQIPETENNDDAILENSEDEQGTPGPVSRMEDNKPNTKYENQRSQESVSDSNASQQSSQGFVPVVSPRATNYSTMDNKDSENVDKAKDDETVSNHSDESMEVESEEIAMIDDGEADNEENDSGISQAHEDIHTKSTAEANETPEARVDSNIPKLFESSIESEDDEDETPLVIDENDSDSSGKEAKSLIKSNLMSRTFKHDTSIITKGKKQVTHSANVSKASKAFDNTSDSSTNINLKNKVINSPQISTSHTNNTAKISANANTNNHNTNKQTDNVNKLNNEVNKGSNEQIANSVPVTIENVMVPDQINELLKVLQSNAIAQSAAKQSSETKVPDSYGTQSSETKVPESFVTQSSKIKIPIMTTVQQNKLATGTIPPPTVVTSGASSLLKSGISQTLYFHDGDGFKPVKIFIDDSQQSSLVLQKMLQAKIASLSKETVSNVDKQDPTKLSTGDKNDSTKSRNVTLLKSQDTTGINSQTVQSALGNTTDLIADKVSFITPEHTKSASNVILNPSSIYHSQTETQIKIKSKPSSINEKIGEIASSAHDIMQNNIDKSERSLNKEMEKFVGSLGVEATKNKTEETVAEGCSESKLNDQPLNNKMKRNKTIDNVSTNVTVGKDVNNVESRSKGQGQVKGQCVRTNSMPNIKVMSHPKMATSVNQSTTSTVSVTNMPNLTIMSNANRKPGPSSNTFPKTSGFAGGKGILAMPEGTLTRVNPDIKSRLSKALQSPQRKLNQTAPPPSGENGSRYPNIQGIPWNHDAPSDVSINAKTVTTDTRQQL